MSTICRKSLPKIGMIFDTLKDVEKFYKSYAHDVGFSVRVGQHKKANEEILFKRYYCSREGCGCQAHIVVRFGSDKKYKIVSMVEEHSHGFVSPDKRHLLRSNRRVSEKAKSTLFNCHKASIGTSQAYRLLHVSEGGFENVGTKIKDADAQMFVAQLERKKEVNPAFFYDFMVDEQRRLVRVFWADALCRKNYSIFWDVVSVDATYTTNQYNMKFVPFTRVNHHLQSLFETILKAMGGVAPHLITTDEDVNMKAAIAKIRPDTAHRLCMWHIMEKVPEKVGPSLREDERFWERLNKYAIRESWIPVYFFDIPLAGMLRTTSRSESANSFFNRFIHRKLTFVEFWLRFDTALECQRQEELKADNVSLHTTPKLMTPWPMEKQCSEQIVAARDHCIVQGISECGDGKCFTISSLSGKNRVVEMNTTNMVGRCFCKLYESYGISCRHNIQVLCAEKRNEVPSNYILKSCGQDLSFDEEGNLLDEKPKDPREVAMRKKISESRNKFEDLIQMAKNSEQWMNFLYSSLSKLVEPLQNLTPAMRVDKQDEYESFLGNKITTEVDIHPRNDIGSKGRSKRIRKSKEKETKKKERSPLSEDTTTKTTDQRL
ncbi:hypothetical protein PVAP13_9NG390273 [Panicum virgatum]|uniref:SWIM-type domain-containing protein n=1 Tax=Panicum virgatum TaxID=38727 RepID=A0A8T0MTE9_PANVG|nr:hypothetical protein PVAP13_9NG390273 [Panicum virgatum]